MIFKNYMVRNIDKSNRKSWREKKQFHKGEMLHIDLFGKEKFQVSISKWNFGEVYFVDLYMLKEKHLDFTQN